MKKIILLIPWLLSTLNPAFSTAFGFEGRIVAVTMCGSQTDTLLYTEAANFLRVENTATNRPNPMDILDLNSGELTLLFPHNRSFVRLKNAAQNPSAMTPRLAPQMPVPPPPPAGIGATNFPAPAALPMPQMPTAGGMPAMPMMPPPMMEKMELKSTGEKTNLLGFTCEHYQIKQRGETMEIWATDQLLPFQPYVQSQPHRFGSRMMEYQWGDLLKAGKLFPLLAVLKYDNGAERFRFEVKSVTPQKLKDRDLNLFQPPDGYFEIQPLPF